MLGYFGGWLGVYEPSLREIKREMSRSDLR